VLLEPLIPEDEEFFGRLLMLECDFFIELERWLFMEPDLLLIPLDVPDDMLLSDIPPLPDMPAPWLMPPPDMPAPPPVD
jgi:hypothetical protein